MRVRFLLIYFVIPLGLTLSFIAMYFSGVPWFEHFVVPAVPGLNPNSWRELGFLENLQNVFIMATIVFSLTAAAKKPLLWQKIVMGSAAALSFFVLLEETDYGLHYIEYFSGAGLVAGLGSDLPVRNVHNIGDLTDIIKRFVDAGLILLFAAAPFAFAHKTAPAARTFLPNRWSLATLLAMVLTSGLAHRLEKAGLNPDGMMNNNLSEFRELVLYYLVMIYFYELVFERTWPTALRARKARGKIRELVVR
ncbi:MAG: hypothetical protein HY548_03860 [Elusimicrobia bacterium]|nr:hypothetical protein [Elusimicrobiota bacterium]